MAKKLGIALAGGGAWSIAGLGVMKALDEAGIKIDYIAAVSMGGIIAAGYASYFAGDDTIKEIEKLVQKMNLRKSFSFNPKKPFGLFSSDKMEAGLKKQFGDLKFEDLKIPLSIIATDYHTGEPVVFNKGPIVPALTASSSFTVLFTPYEYEGKLLTDGGSSNPTPTGIVRSMGADVVIAIDTTSQEYLTRLKHQPKGWHHKVLQYIPPLHYMTTRHMRRSFWQLIDILYSNLNRAQLAIDPPDILLTPYISGLEHFSFHRADEFIKQGEKVTRDSLPEIKRLLDLEN